jgi:arylsulfatase A-like enzyme
MKRTAFFLLLACFTLFACNKKSESKRPNIILIMADDQGWGDLSIKGNTNISTPNIDQLATSGVSFDKFYVSPVCSPTRAELLTGRYHVRGGVFSTSTGGERLDLDEQTLAEVFKKAGYATAAYGKWHNGMQPPYHPNARGFDDYYGFCSGHWGNYFSPMLEHNGKIVQGEGFLIDDFTNHGLNFIEEHKENSFFLYLPFHTPHSPYQVPDKWWNKFKDKELEMLHRDPEKEDLQQTRAALAMCENIDWNVGRIVNKIEALDLAENTIIVYLSDNGPNTWRWNKGMKGKKGSTDEGGVRSPFIINWPKKLEAGKTITHIAAVIDLLPTLADLAEIEYTPRKKLDGISLKPLLFETNTNWNERTIVSHWRNRTSIRNQRYRLDTEGRLYDMEADPGQTENIAGKNPTLTAELNMQLENWKTDVLVELPKTEERPFTLGHPNFDFAQFPARDARATGTIQRSDNSPNCTFYTNWTSTSDIIFWPTEVMESGTFEVDLYYTCAPEDVGTEFILRFGNNQLKSKITAAHNPPLKGMENDRVLRTQSYVKEFKKMTIGTIYLDKGRGDLSLTATNIPGRFAFDFRLLMFRRVDEK